MSLIFATQLTAIATAVLAVFAMATAYYARKAFRSQSKEVGDQATMLKVQSDQLEEQRKINALQAKDLEASLKERERLRRITEREQASAISFHWWPANEVLILRQPLAGPEPGTSVLVIERVEPPHRERGVPRRAVRRRRPDVGRRRDRPAHDRSRDLESQGHPERGRRRQHRPADPGRAEIRLPAQVRPPRKPRRPPRGPVHGRREPPLADRPGPPPRSAGEPRQLVTDGDLSKFPEAGSVPRQA